MMKSILIHNPRCGKSRGAKEILEGKGISFITLDYLKDGLPDEILTDLPKLLKLNYPDMVRTKEDIYNELNLANKTLSDSEWIKVLKQHPVLLERPIFIHNSRAIIARPSEKVLDII